MCDVRPSVRNIPTCLCQDALMIVTVEEGILNVSFPAILAPARSADPIRLQTRLLKNNVQLPRSGCRTALRNMSLDGEHKGVRLLQKGVVGLLLHFSRFGCG